MAERAFLLASVASRVFHPSGGATTFLHVLGVVALLVWALDEIVRGVNPFRRLLGGAVLVATVATVADLALRSRRWRPVAAAGACRVSER
jgi:hypothetical protein